MPVFFFLVRISFSFLYLSRERKKETDMIDRRLASQNKLWPFFSIILPLMIHHAGATWGPFTFLREVKVRRTLYIYTYSQSKSPFYFFFRKCSCCFSLFLFRSLWYIIHLTRLVGIQVVKHFFDLFFLTHPHRRST